MSICFGPGTLLDTGYTVVGRGGVGWREERISSLHAVFSPVRVLENIPETPSISGHEFLRWQRNQDAPLLRTVIGFRMQIDMQSQKEDAGVIWREN